MSCAAERLAALITVSVLVSGISAQKPKTIDLQSELAELRGPFYRELLASEAPDKLRRNYRSMLLGVIDRYFRSNAGHRDVDEAYRALCREEVQLKGREAYRVVARLLRRDPKTSEAANLLAVASRPAAGVDSTTHSIWLLHLRSQTEISGEASRAVDVSIAELGLERGDPLTGWELLGRVSRDRSISAALRTRAKTLTRAYRTRVRETSHTTTAVDWSQMITVWREMRQREWKALPEAVWQAAGTLGPEVSWATVLLASAHSEPPPHLPKLGREHQNGRHIVAWSAYASGDMSAWSEARDHLGRPNAKVCLETLDTIFDLKFCHPSLHELLAPIIRKTKSAHTRALALRILSYQDLVRSPRGFVRASKSRIWQVRLALAEALGAYRHTDAVEQLSNLLADEHARIRHAAHDRLVTLTGRDLGLDKKAWHEWSLDPNSRIAPLRSPDRVVRSRNATTTRANYYGLRIESNRFVLVLDNSESMYYGLWDAAVRDANEFLGHPGKTARFGVVVFESDADTWKDKLVLASEANRKRARRYLEGSRPYGATNIIDALRKSAEVEGCDTLILLSDGMPNRGDPMQPDAIRRAFAKLNRHARLRVHTVYFVAGRRFPFDTTDRVFNSPLSTAQQAKREADRALAQDSELGRFLRALAEDNDGQSRIGFGDFRDPSPDTPFRETSDK